MNKIRFTANMDTNYVFHMLSVAKCGYDNRYGEGYRNRYPREDLALLKRHEEWITVRGGEHCGKLFGILVCRAAEAKMSAKEYYTGLIQLAAKGAIPRGMEEYREEIRQIAAVMARHYDDYAENLWAGEQRKIMDYIPGVRQLFEESGFTDKAERAVGCDLPGDFFTATLVTSVENGPEAIDISKEQDVFGIERTPFDAFYFIGHEFIIYLLFNALKEENAFRELATWNITEGLAEYYLKRILGDTRFFRSRAGYVAFFEKLQRENQFTAAELYRKALEAFLPGKF